MTYSSLVQVFCFSRRLWMTENAASRERQGGRTLGRVEALYNRLVLMERNRVVKPRDARSCRCCDSSQKVARELANMEATYFACGGNDVTEERACSLLLSDDRHRREIDCVEAVFYVSRVDAPGTGSKQNNCFRWRVASCPCVTTGAMRTPAYAPREARRGPGNVPLPFSSYVHLLSGQMCVRQESHGPADRKICKAAGGGRSRITRWRNAQGMAGKKGIY